MPEDPSWLIQLRSEVLEKLEKHGVSQSELARYLGVSRSLVNQVLLGQVKGTPTLLDGMAAAVGLRINVARAKTAPLLRGRKCAC